MDSRVGNLGLPSGSPNDVSVRDATKLGKCMMMGHGFSFGVRIGPLRRRDVGCMNSRDSHDHASPLQCIDSILLRMQQYNLFSV